MNNYYELLKQNNISNQKSEHSLVFEMGKSSSNVTSIQNKLKYIGFFPGTVTCNYGYDTTAAVMEFQKANSLRNTGIVDKETWDALSRENDSIIRQSSTTPVLDRPILKYGDQGEYVKLLQTQLKQLMFYNGNIDGNFENVTLESVKAFQANNKIVIDGIVGKDTWSALIYLYSPLAVCVGNFHIVQQGETLWSIAKKYNTTVDELMRLNNLTSTTLSIGQKLIVPGEGTTPSPNNIIYTVQRGDTLWSLAQRFNTTVTAIKNLNNLTTDTLSIGQQLTIPGTANVTIYTVQRGDTLWSLAQRFNTTATAIKNLNNLTTDTLSIGQQLKIKTG